jgi:AraC-like DNA-binding protein
MRLWQAHFQMYQPLRDFPKPHEIVEEIQETPKYRINENLRKRDGSAQLVITVSGRGVFEKGARKVDLIQGKAFLAEHGTDNMSYYYPEDGTEPWIFLWISFHLHGCQAILNDMINSFGHIYNITPDSPIVERLYHFKHYDNTIQSMSRSAGASLVLEILTLVGKSKINKSRHDPQNELVRMAREYVMKNIGKDFGVSDIAENLNVSREHLSRIFKQNMRISLTDFIRDKKMHTARHLLMDSTLSCANIAERTGYRNAASFSRTFKKLVGTTPEKFRKQEY